MINIADTDARCILPKGYAERKFLEQPKPGHPERKVWRQPASRRDPEDTHR